MSRAALQGMWSREPRLTQSHRGLAKACRAGRWYQGLLTAPDEASDKPGPEAIQGAVLGAKQTESGTGLETSILQQHQGRNQQPWDGLKCGPGQSAGTVKLNGVPGALTAAWYLMFTSSLYCSSPSMQYIIHVMYGNDTKVYVSTFALILFLW